MFIYFALVFAVAAWGVHLALRWKQARDFAPELLKARKATGELPEGVKEDEFTDLYLRAEGPRASTYIYACAVLMTLLLAPISTGFNMVWDAFWTLSGQSPVFEQGTLIHTFSFFLTIMGLTIALLALALHRYYTLTPPNLKQVIRNLREVHG
ncbi:MAG: hypothetical protein ACK4P2_07435 [Hyphomonas sp.]